MTWRPAIRRCCKTTGNFLKPWPAARPICAPSCCATRNFCADLLSQAPEDLLTSLCAGLHAAQTLATQAEIMAALRHAKAKASLLIALADLGEVWSVDEVTAALTRFADAMLGATVNWLLLDATRAGKFRCIDENDPSRHCGYVVLAMGKHGAGELNYSSDIDLIILYDPETAPTGGRRRARHLLCAAHQAARHDFAGRDGRRLRLSR